MIGMRGSGVLGAPGPWPPPPRSRAWSPASPSGPATIAITRQRTATKEPRDRNRQGIAANLRESTDLGGRFAIDRTAHRHHGGVPADVGDVSTRVGRPCQPRRQLSYVHVRSDIHLLARNLQQLPTTTPTRQVKHRQKKTAARSESFQGLPAARRVLSGAGYRSASPAVVAAPHRGPMGNSSPPAPSPSSGLSPHHRHRPLPQPPKRCPSQNQMLTRPCARWSSHQAAVQPRSRRHPSARAART